MLEALLHEAGIGRPGVRGGRLGWGRPGGRRSCTPYGSRPTPPMAGAMLFSPEVDLLLDEPSISARRRARHPAVEHPHAPLPPRPGPRRRSLSGGGPGRLALAADLRLLRSRGDVPRRHPRLGRPPGGRRGRHEWPRGTGMFHDFPILMPWAEGSRRAYREVGEFVRSHLPDRGSAGSPVTEVDPSPPSRSRSVPPGRIRKDPP